MSLAALAVALTLVAEIALQAVEERERVLHRQDAAEAAANVLEAARALPWDDLTPDWARRQALPEALAARLPDGRLDVRIAPDPSSPRTRRVSAEIHWREGRRRAPQSLGLVGLYSPRSAPKATPAGGRP